MIPILADPAKRLGDRIFADLSGAIVAEEHRLFDIAGERVPDASVSTETCAPVDAGSDALCSVWQDPTFDVATPAVYYARVVEVPSCRWTQWACVDAKVDCEDAAGAPEGFEFCCGDEIPKTLQERAWSSPIWYRPQPTPDLAATNASRAD